MFCFQCLKIGSDIFEESLFSFYWKWIVWLSRLSDCQWAFSMKPKNGCTYVEREIKRVVYNFANYTRIIFIFWVTIVVFLSSKVLNSHNFPIVSAAQIHKSLIQGTPIQK